MYSVFQAHFQRSKQPQLAGFECKKHLEYVYMYQPTTPKVYVLVALQGYLPLLLKAYTL